MASRVRRGRAPRGPNRRVALRRLRRRHGGSDRRHPAHHARPRPDLCASQRVPRRAVGRAEQRRGTASETGYRDLGGREERDVRTRARRLRHRAVPGLRYDLAWTNRRSVASRVPAAVPVSLTTRTAGSRFCRCRLLGPGGDRRHHLSRDRPRAHDLRGAVSLLAQRAASGRRSGPRRPWSPGGGPRRVRPAALTRSGLASRCGALSRCPGGR